ncbi:hypothetical protein, partial [Neisseria sp. P0014.S009]|uniref:hypothetical protein n=1 Tax=Neisseria sp. P0014.S009 TaxID=3436755 RepID=UPI003F80D9E0
VVLNHPLRGPQHPQSAPPTYTQNANTHKKNTPLVEKKKTKHNTHAHTIPGAPWVNMPPNKPAANNNTTVAGGIQP